MKKVYVITILVFVVSSSFGQPVQKKKSTTSDSVGIPLNNFRVLHHFAGGDADGAVPLGGLIQSGSTLYGMTKAGGCHGNGTIFRINTDGTGFQLMHSFASGDSDGQYPYGSLLQSGSILYGMAGAENTNYGGTLFQIGTDGTGFQVLHRFEGLPSDGRWPYGSVIQSGSTLYGMTVAGGKGDTGSNLSGGTVFRINTDGTGYKILHHFAGGSDDGSWSAGNLTLVGTYLYGMTYKGGSSDLGTIFKVSTDGAGFQVLHSFSGAPNDGAKTHDSFTQFPSDPALYGTTGNGGTKDLGILFKVNTDGTGFHLLHSFDGGANDVAKPLGARIKSDSIFYGTTKSKSGNGAIFSINTDGSAYQILHDFIGADGARPSDVFRSGSTVYGMTWKGGSQNLGVIFALTVPESAPRSARPVAAGIGRKLNTTSQVAFDYLGQPSPGPIPVVFVRGLISTDNLEHSAPAFSPDGNEVFWSLWRQPDKGEPQVIMTMRREGGTWSAPTVAPFSGKFVDGGPVFSADGRRIYFYSTRPTPAGKTSDDIWFVEKHDNGWGKPHCLGFVARFSEMKAVYQPSITCNGTLYFISRPKITLYDNTLQGSPNAFLIYRAELINGEYPKPELLPQSINAPDAYVNWTPFIAPDESYLIFSSCRGTPADDRGDLYVCFRRVDASWTDPVNMGEPVNSPAQERFPAVSPDGKYLFFTRPTPGHSHDVYWVSAGIIEKLKAKAIQELRIDSEIKK